MNKTRLSVVTAVAALITSCATNRGTINSYVEPTYTQGSIKRLALFSIRNAGRAPAEARDINVKIAQAIVAKNPSVEIMAPSASLSAINDAGLAAQWADFVEDYYTSGIANKVVLQEIATALKVDAVLQGQLVNVWQQDGGGMQKATTRITVNFSIVEAATAKVVWEATADGIRAKGTKTAPPIADAIKLAVDKIVENLPLL